MVPVPSAKVQGLAVSKKGLEGEIKQLDLNMVKIVQGTTGPISIVNEDESALPVNLFLLFFVLF